MGTAQCKLCISLQVISLYNCSCPSFLQARHFFDMQPVKKVQLLPNDVKLLAIKGYTVGDALNSGSFACVCKATYKDKPAAVKVIDLEKTSDDYRLKFLPRELYTIKKLKHRFLVRVIDIYVIGNRVLVFMELANGGDFLDLLHETKALSEDRTRFFYSQFGDALRYMHSIGFAHRDIKVSNVKLLVSRILFFNFNYFNSAKTFY